MNTCPNIQFNHVKRGIEWMNEWHEWNEWMNECHLWIIWSEPAKLLKTAKARCVVLGFQRLFRKFTQSFHLVLITTMILICHQQNAWSKAQFSWALNPPEPSILLSHESLSSLQFVNSNTRSKHEISLDSSKNQTDNLVYTNSDCLHYVTHLTWTRPLDHQPSH